MKALGVLLAGLLLSAPIRGYAADGTASFEVQLPADPGGFDAPLSSTQTCDIPVNPLVVKWRTPTGGVSATTGLVVVLPGNHDTFDCDRIFEVHDPAWPDAKNVVVCNVFYRNNTFKVPYDFGKMQVGDALRGTARVLQEFPQLDRRRLYLWGASGGGHLALQVLQGSRHLWAEVHVHCAPTLVTTDHDVAARGYNADAFGDGFHPMLGFPIEQGTLSDAAFARYEAERALRSPQKNVASDLPTSTAGEFPPVWSMHGSADEGVDFQHFEDMKQAVQVRMGQTPIATAVLGGMQWKLREWTFVRIDGATHSYGGAHTSMNTFAKATNAHVPSAFTRQRPAVPALTVDYAFPWHHGWRFRVGGGLNQVVVTTEQQPTAAADWELFN